MTQAHLDHLQARCDRLSHKPRSEAYREALQRLREAKNAVLRRGVGNG